MPPKESFTRPNESAELTMDQLKIQLEGMSTEKVTQEYNLVLNQAVNPKRETKRRLADLSTRVLQTQMDKAQQAGNQDKVLSTQEMIKRGMEFQKIDDLRDAAEHIDALINPQLDVYRQVLAHKITSEVIAKRKKPSESMKLLVERIENAKLDNDLKLIQMATQLIFSAEMNELNDKVIADVKKQDPTQLEANLKTIASRKELGEKLPQDTVITMFLATDLFAEDSIIFDQLNSRMKKGKLPIRKIQEFAVLLKPLYQEYLKKNGLESAAFQLDDPQFLKLLADHQVQQRLDDFNDSIIGPDGIEVRVHEPAHKRVEALKQTRTLVLREQVRLENRKSMLESEGKKAEAELLTARIQDLHTDALLIQNAIDKIGTADKTTRHLAAKSSSRISFAPGIRADFRGDYGVMNTGVMKKTFNGISDGMDYVADKIMYHVGEPKSLGDMNGTNLAIYAGMSVVSLGFLVGITQGVWGTVQSALEFRNPKNALKKAKETAVRASKSLVVPSILVGGYLFARENKDAISNTLDYAADSIVPRQHLRSKVNTQVEKGTRFIKDDVWGAVNSVWDKGWAIGGEKFQELSLYLEKEFGVKAPDVRKHLEVQQGFEDQLEHYFQQSSKVGVSTPSISIDTKHFNKLIVAYKAKVKLSGKDPERNPQPISLEDLKNSSVITAEQYHQLKAAIPEEKQSYIPKPSISRQLVDQSHWYAANFLKN